MKKNFILLIILGCMGFNPMTAQKTVYVRESGVDNMEQLGTLEAPFKTINYALTKCALTGDTIDVLGTIIAADSLGTPNKTIPINNGKGVTIIGHGTDKTILQPATNKDDCANRIFSFANASKTVIKNLTIRWGNVVGQASEDGGNINIWQSEVVFDNVVISEARARRGAGLSVQGSNNEAVVLKNCVFTGNRALTYGGALFMTGTGSQGSSVEIYNSLLSYNSTISDTSKGGAIWLDTYQTQPASLSIYNSTIAFNRTPTSCAAIGTSSNTQAPMKMTLWGNTIAYNVGELTTNITNVSGAGAWWAYMTPNLTVDMLNNLFMENKGKSWSIDHGDVDVSFRGPTLARVSYNIFTNNLPDWYIHNPSVGTDADPEKTNIYNDNSKVLLANELADNGGPTHTLSVAENSTAINVGMFNPLPFMQKDQRGKDRSMTPTIGAYEFGTLSTTKNVLLENAVFYNRQNQELVLNENVKSVSIYSVMGRMLLQSNITNNILSVRELESNTVYITTAILKNGKRTTYKFIKQ